MTNFKNDALSSKEQNNIEGGFLFGWLFGGWGHRRGYNRGYRCGRRNYWGW